MPLNIMMVVHSIDTFVTKNECPCNSTFSMFWGNFSLQVCSKNVFRQKYQITAMKYMYP